MELQSNITTTYDLLSQNDDHTLTLCNNETMNEMESKESNQPEESLFDRIQALTKQIAANQLLFDTQLKQYQQTLIEKDYQIEKQKQLIEKEMKDHHEQMNDFQNKQQQKMVHVESLYDKEKSKLYNQLKKRQDEVKSGEIEKLLNDFEQEQHSYLIDDDYYSISSY
ncbi:unnamed protein product [Cunninghamella blakesleeana]